MRFLLLLPFLFMGLQSWSQEVNAIYFEDLGEWMEAEDDTLYVLNFWATWCRPCVAEMPFFEQIAEENADAPLKVIFLSLDFVEDLETKLQKFVARKQVKSAVYLLDEPKYNEWMGKVSEEWTGAIPATLFVNHSRDIYHFHEGEFTYEELAEQVKAILSPAHPQNEFNH